MSQTDKDIEAILMQFAEEFASRSDDGSWWGHDTDLGDCKAAFQRAARRIKQIKRGSIPVPKQYKHYAELSGLNRKAIAKAIYGVPSRIHPAWHGSIAEFEVLSAIKRNKI